MLHLPGDDCIETRTEKLTRQYIIALFEFTSRGLKENHLLFITPHRDHFLAIEFDAPHVLLVVLVFCGLQLNLRSSRPFEGRRAGGVGGVAGAACWVSCSCWPLHCGCCFWCRFFCLFFGGCHLLVASSWATTLTLLLPLLQRVSESAVASEWELALRSQLWVSRCAHHQTISQRLRMA